MPRRRLPPPPTAPRSRRFRQAPEGRTPRPSTPLRSPPPRSRRCRSIRKCSTIRSMPRSRRSRARPASSPTASSARQPSAASMPPPTTMSTPSSSTWNAGAGCREHLGKFYVRVNIPDFNLDIYKDGQVIYTTRIVVGKPTKQTPIFSDEIEHVIVNPAWNVPASIAVKEMLPQIQANPGKALAGYQVFANIGGRFRADRPVHGRLAQRRHAPHPDQAAAGRAQRAGLGQVHVPQPLRRLPARHARRRACSRRTTAPTAMAACG